MIGRSLSVYNAIAPACYWQGVDFNQRTFDETMAETVFYAWQSDRSQKLHRYLIRDAATAACKRITEDPTNTWELKLDEATLGAPGMCDIPNTILEKISDCSVFLGDLTFVGRLDGGDEELTSNPNVLFELGFAAASIGFDRIVGVMNVVHGQPERQMFDVKRRWAVRYEAAESADAQSLKKIGAGLSKEIEAAIRTILATVGTAQSDEGAGPRFQKIRDDFERSLRAGHFHRLNKREGLIAVTIVPEVISKIDHNRLQHCTLEPPVQRTHVGGWDSGIRGSSVLTIASYRDQQQPTPVPYAIGELTTEGIMRAANSRVLDADVHAATWRRFQLENVVLNNGAYIPSIDLESTIVDTVMSSLTKLTELGVQGRVRVGVSLLGVRGFCFLANQTDTSEITLEQDDIIVDYVETTCSAAAPQRQAVGDLLRDVFDFVWREFGYAGSASYDSQGNWHSRRGL